MPVCPHRDREGARRVTVVEDGVGLSEDVLRDVYFQG